MGYRHYLYAVPKNQVAEIQACKTNDDWCNFSENYGYEVSRDYCIDDEVKKFLGVPPYDDSGNICKGDPIFYQSLCSIYGEKQVQEAMKIHYQIPAIGMQNN